MIKEDMPDSPIDRYLFTPEVIHIYANNVDKLYTIVDK
jgi:hypothetical protein